MSFKQKNIVITSAARTAIGTFGGSLKNKQAHELGTFAVKEAMKRSQLNPMIQILLLQEVRKVCQTHLM